MTRWAGTRSVVPTMEEPTKRLLDGLRALVEEWRATARSSVSRQTALALDRCADDLEREIDAASMQLRGSVGVVMPAAPPPP